MTVEMPGSCQWAQRVRYAFTGGSADTPSPVKWCACEFPCPPAHAVCVCVPAYAACRLVRVRTPAPAAGLAGLRARACWEGGVCDAQHDEQRGPHPQ